MADITALLAGAAKTNANFNFDELGKSYWGGLEEAYKRRTRDAFQDPSLYDAQGNIDPAKAINAALKAGGPAAAEQVKSLYETGALQRRQSNTANTYQQLYGPDGQQGGQRDEPPISAPPSTSQSGAKTQAAPDLTQPQGRPQTKFSAPQAAGGPQAGPFTQFLTAQGVPPEQHGAASAALQQDMVRLTGRPFDTNAPLNMNDGNVRDVLKKFAFNNAMQKRGGVQGAMAQAPVEAPPQQQAALAPQAGARQPAVPPQAVQPAPSAPPQQLAQAPVPPQRVPIQQQQPPIPQRPVQTEQIQRPTVANDPSLGGVVTPQDIRRFGNWQNALNAYEKALAHPDGIDPGLRVELEKKVGAIRDQLKFTEGQKEYEYAKARDPNIPPKPQWEAEKAAREARVKVDTGTAEELSKNAAQIYPTLSVLNEAIRLGKSAPGGMAGPAAVHLGRIMSSLGMKVPESFSDAEALNAIAVRLLPLVRQPGAVSNYEQQSYMAALPSLLQSKEGRIKAAEMMLKLARNGLETARIYRDHIGAPDLHDRLAAMDKPVLSEVEREELEKIVKAARGSDNKGWTEPQPGIRMRTRTRGE